MNDSGNQVDFLQKTLESLLLREAVAKAEREEQITRQELFKAAALSVRFKREEIELEFLRDFIQRHKQLKRPCMNLPVKVRPEWRADGKVYIAECGELAAEGDTPEEAYAAFDRLWIGGDEL